MRFFGVRGETPHPWICRKDTSGPRWILCSENCGSPESAFPPRKWRPAFPYPAPPPRGIWNILRRPGWPVPSRITARPAAPFSCTVRWIDVSHDLRGVLHDTPYPAVMRFVGNGDRAAPNRSRSRADFMTYAADRVPWSNDRAPMLTRGCPGKTLCFAHRLSPCTAPGRPDR